MLRLLILLISNQFHKDNCIIMGLTPPQKIVHNHYYYPQYPYQAKPKISNAQSPSQQKTSSQFSNNPQNFQKETYFSSQFQETGHKDKKFYVGQEMNKKEDPNLIQGKILDEKKEKLLKIISEYEKGIQKAQQYGKKMQDPDKFQEYKKESLEMYIKNIKQLNLQQKHISEDGTCIKSIIGRISCGKSSLLNNLLKLKLQTGMGQTTSNLDLVYNQNGIKIIDTPGENEDFNSFKLDNVNMIAMCNQVYILYPDSLKNVQNLVRVVTAIKPHHTYLIRTHCDKASKKDNKTIEEEVKTDYQILNRWGIKGIKILLTSAKGQNLFDNLQVKQMLLRYPKKI